MRKKYKRLRVGVIGVGSMGEHHARIYSTLSSVKLAGVADIEEERASLIAEKYNTKFFTDYRALLKEVDAVSLATPTATHYDIGIACIEEGVHLLIEKPLTRTKEESERLLALSKEKKVVLATGLIERFNPAFVAVSKLIKKEKPLIIDAKRLSPFPERISDTSVIFDMMIHDLDLILKIAGAPVLSLKAEGKKIRSSSLDQAFVSIFFKNGLIANIEASRVAEEKIRLITINCEKSNIEADLLRKKVSMRFLPDPLKPLGPPRVKRVPLKKADQLTLELKDFISAIKNKRPLKVAPEEGIKALALASEIEKSLC